MDSLFFVAAKIAWALLRFETWLLVLLALALWGQLRGRVRLSSLASGAALAALLAIGFLPLGDPLLRRIELVHPSPDLPERVDGIIILGGAEDAVRSAEWGAPQVNEAAERLISGALLAERFPEARVVFTGGSGSLVQVHERGADWAGPLLIDLGIEPERLLLERNSRNTAENAVMSRLLAQPQEGELWILVTSAFHMPRAMRSFEAAGWPEVIAYPVDYRSLPFGRGIGWDPAGHIHTFNLALKEQIGLAAYAIGRR